MKPDDDKPDWLEVEWFQAAVGCIYVIGTVVGIYILWKLR
jgi:hypothetical protein